MKNDLIKEIRQHKVPAPATIQYMEESNEKFNGFTIMINNIQNDIKNINKSLEDNTSQHKEIMVCLTSLNEKLDTKYAGKWIEKTFIGIGISIGLAVLGAVLNLIIKQ